MKIRPGSTTAGQKMAGMSSPPIWMSQPGMRRTPPSSQPMYQSGCAAVVASQARYGPYSHTGLICTNAANAVQTPATMSR